ncbi:SigB/SigF/SigG family RNA polymerase sigma factor [Antrihabitans cavernicola]|uniref:SigB/SigF/SigG family RNA polymerase sigma factor n=2 Tax=Antrihabitans cavernicola TaxID=2495913 RepID=A0A5A7S4U5_9NOCA|nr:SigB/SigF/SigG family RNA polymerase sigma factor [Spelaeibacter cavernicola]
MHARSRTARADDTRRDYEHLEPLLEQLAARADDPGAQRRLREEIIRCALPLADNIALHFSNRGERSDDLLQVARVGLIHAIDRFDIARKSRFLPYAILTMMGEVRHHFRDRTWPLHVPRSVQDTVMQIRPVIAELSQRLGRAPTPREVANSCGIDYALVVDALAATNACHTLSVVNSTQGDDSTMTLADTLGDVDPGYDVIDGCLTVKALTEQLPDRERQVLRLRFVDSMTQTQIATQIGISQMQVSRILRRTIDQLRELTPTD